MTQHSLRRILFHCLVVDFMSRQIATAVPTHNNIDTLRILSRDDLQCKSDQYTKCDASFPGNFCCSKGSTCVAMNSGKSAICCPEGRGNCDVIGTISCDVQQQNATAHPLSQLFTTDLSVSLQKCGDQCCPAGMTCQGDSQCVKGSALTTSSSAAPTASTTTSPSTSSTPSSGGASPSNNASTQQPAAAQSKHNQFTTAGILVGASVGLGLGLLALIIFICCKRRRKTSDRPVSEDLTSTVQASISDPIYPEGSEITQTRSDFLRKAKSSSQASTTSRIKSFLSRKSTIMTSRTKSSPSVVGFKTPKPSDSPPKTPASDRASMESIKIYSPPNLGREHHVQSGHTTFEEMMQQVGLQEGRFLGSPTQVDPRAKRTNDLRSSSLDRR